MSISKKIAVGFGFGLLALLASVLIQGHHAYAAARRTNYTAAEIKAATVHFDSAWVANGRLIAQVYLQFSDKSKVYMNGFGAGDVFTVDDSDKRLLQGGYFCDASGPNLSTLQVFLPLDSNGNLIPNAGGLAKVFTQNPEKNSFNVYQKNNSVPCITRSSFWPTDTKVYDLNAPTDVGLQDALNKLHNSKFKFTDGYNISVNYAGDNKDYTFYDKNPFDDNPNYAQTDSSPFCHSTEINLNISDISSLNDPSKPVPALIKLSYLGKNADGSGYSCQDRPDPVQVKIDNSDRAATQILAWDGANIIPLDTSGIPTWAQGAFVLKQQPNHQTFYELNTSDHCGGGLVVQLPKDGAGSGTLWKLSNSGSDKTIGGYKFTNCQEDTSGNITGLGSRAVTLAGTQGKTLGGSHGGGGSSTNTDNACEANSSFSLNWVMCPVLRIIDDFVNKVNSIIDSQLNFDVNQNLNANVYQAWSIFRVIASSLIVVVLLVMIFSQAVSVGPFDAYTIRKLLPRLVAAVILIQLSWVFSEYIIKLANDFGQGISQLLSLPFGGMDALGFDKLVGQINAAAPTGVVVGGFLAGAVALAINPFGAVMMGFVVIMSIITALAVLLLRQALIIACVIFMPIALVAWVLPGTERYWKLLWDNFTKALMLFPIIAALITVGRIFAWIVGSGGGSGPIVFFAVIIGFFGPYFLLPKAFKWGGQAMQLGGNAIMKAGDKMSERPKKYFKDRQEELNNQKKISAANRLRQWDQKQMNRRQKFGSIIRGDKFKAGDWDPAYVAMPLGRKELKRQQESKMQRFRAGAARAENEEREFAIQKLEEEAVHSSFGPGKEDKFYEHVWSEYKAGRRTETEGFAALEKLLAVGGDPGAGFVLTEAQQAHANGNKVDASGKSIATAEETKRNVAFGKFSSRMAQTLYPKVQNLPYYKGDVSAAQGIKAEELVSMATPAVRSMVTNLEATLASPTATADDKAEAQKGLDNLALAFQMAATSEETNRRISPGMLNAFQEFSGSKEMPKEAAQRIQAGVNRMLNRETAPTPGELVVQHTETVTRELPSPGSLAPGTPDREAFKIQLESNPAAVQTLARGIAYGVAAPEYQEVLAEMRNEALAAGTPEAKEAYNYYVGQIQQAYQQRIDETTRAFESRGHDPTTARSAAGGRLAPEIVNLESTAPPPPPGALDLRKL